MTNQSLITRLREAEGASRELDAEIAFVCGWRPHMPKRHRNNPRARYEQCTVNPGTYELWIGGQPCGKEKYVPKYTASLDAALALVREVLPPLWHLEIFMTVQGLTAVQLSDVDVGRYPDVIKKLDEVEHKSPAIALLIALLQAQGVQE